MIYLFFLLQRPRSSPERVEDDDDNYIPYVPLKHRRIEVVSSDWSVHHFPICFIFLFFLLSL